MVVWLYLQVRTSRGAGEPLAKRRKRWDLGPVLGGLCGDEQRVDPSRIRGLELVADAEQSRCGRAARVRRVLKRLSGERRRCEWGWVKGYASGIYLP